MADAKITALTELTAVDAGDLLPIVDDPAGTPVTKKITVGNVLEALTGAQQVYGTAADTACVGNDSRLSDARSPTAHASSHENGGADELALDASQITTGTVATARLGSGTADATTFLRGDQTYAVPGGGALTYQEADRATDLALSTSFQAAASLSLAAGTWLVMGQSSIESTSTTQGNVNIRIRDQTNSVTYSIAEAEVDSALPDRQSLMVQAVIVLTGTATIALEGRQSAGTSHMIGPGNLSDTATKVTRITAIKIA